MSEPVSHVWDLEQEQMCLYVCGVQNTYAVLNALEEKKNKNERGQTSGSTASRREPEEKLIKRAGLHMFPDLTVNM